MRGVISFIFWFLLILIAVSTILTGISYFGDFRLRGATAILSPLPSLLVNSLYKEADASEFWVPNIDKKEKGTSDLRLSSRAAISYDLTTDKLIYGKNIDQKLPLASLTKIMTAVIALENMDLDDEIVVSKSAAEIGENAMGLTAGEQVSVRDLLYGLILHSGNDAAEALAQGSPFEREDFVHVMNRKAENLGLSNTRFTNPSGLEGDGIQYSTVYDLLVLTRLALQNEEFIKVTSTVDYEIPQTSDHKYFYLSNQTNLLTTYPGVKGVKTGYTEEAGMCLVTYLEYKGHKIVAVLLNSENRRQEMKDLLDYSLERLGVAPPPHS